MLARLDEERAVELPLVLALASALAKCLSFYVKVFYVMGKALSGELSCPCDRSCFCLQSSLQHSPCISVEHTHGCSTGRHASAIHHTCTCRCFLLVPISLYRLLFALFIYIGYELWMDDLRFYNLSKSVSGIPHTNFSYYTLRNVKIPGTSYMVPNY